MNTDAENPQQLSGSLRPSQVAQAPPTSSVPRSSLQASQQYGSQSKAAPAPQYSSTGRPSVGGAAARYVTEDAARMRFCVIVFGILVVICLGVVAIVLPLVLDSYCDCEKSNVSGPTPSPAPDQPTVSPSTAPTSGRFSQFVTNYAAAISGEDAFKNSSSPQYRAAEFIADEASFDDSIGNVDRLGDLYALTTFYYSTGGDAWNRCSKGSTDCPGESWLNATLNHCSWHWITCNEDGRVVDIIFTEADGNNLTGPLPLELGLLTGLRQFVAVNNKITGNFPVEFGQLRNVTRVILASNSMNGTIPDDFLVNSPLQIFMVSGNDFSGAIPISLARIDTLSQLLLSDNRFSGTISDDFGNLPNLGTLDLSNNRLIGTIPDSVYSDTIENLYLGGNQQLQGTISSAIGGATSLIKLRITDTTISGGIPDELFDLPRLAEVELSNNDLSGELSTNVALLGDNLRVLKLDGNNFSGALPSSAIDELIVSTTLKFERNSFTGSISSSTCSRRGTARDDLQELTVDCDEVTCTCCTNC